VNPSDLPLIAPVREWHELFPLLARDHLYEAVRTGQLKALRRGRRVLVSRAALLDFIGEPQPSRAPEEGHD
jgi:excisionase family DNA binding protein